VIILAQPPNSSSGMVVAWPLALLLSPLKPMEAKSSVIMAVIIHSICISMEVVCPHALVHSPLKRKLTSISV